MSNTNVPEQPESRLDRELNEILEESRKRPISFQDRVARKRTSFESTRQETSGRLRSIDTGPIRKAGQLALRVPLLTALAVALLAVWLASDYALVSSLLALVAAALIFVPFVLKRPSDDITYQKRWRGRTIENSSDPGGGVDQTVRSWIDTAKRRVGR